MSVSAVVSGTGQVCPHEEQGLKLNWKRGKNAAVAASIAGTFFLLLSGAGCNIKKDTEGVMATVNGRKITRIEVDKYYNNQTADAPQKPTDEQADTLAPEHPEAVDRQRNPDAARREAGTAGHR